jgi:23S rRNA (uridine2552-2'-O)-methyltransferase
MCAQCTPCRNKVTGSSKAWLQRHKNDQYVKQAEKDNVRSRATYKLQELQDKYKIVKSGDFVIDLGAAPGGWSVEVSKILNFGGGGLLVSVDLLAMEPVAVDAESSRAAFVIQGDFNSPVVRSQMKRLATNSEGTHRLPDVVLSDMLQNTTGHGSTDHFKSMDICYSVLDFTKEYLKPGGHLLCKYFQGSDDKEMLAEAKLQYGSVKLVKPKSSRPESREMYLLAMSKRVINTDTVTSS